jgi:hypothetical protein
VNETPTIRLAHSVNFWIAMEEAGREGSAGLARSGMDDDTCRLVDNDYLVILEQHSKFDFLGDHFGGQLGNWGDNAGANFDPITGLCFNTIDPHTNVKKLTSS